MFLSTFSRVIPLSRRCIPLKGRQCGPQVLVGQYAESTLERKRAFQNTDSPAYEFYQERGAV